ncbi:MAG TPA: glycosyltransferase family 2 protein [Patescibacteria group bacterium]|jgi:hypothetical protein|nr:glycosyltransferase family 2 protein [Patescibacteria group bacterium]
MIKVSIIIVNYKVKEKLLVCLKSIYDSKPQSSFEIMVVDNDEVKTIEKDLKRRFPKVKYIKSSKNLGYGGGNNLGAKYAKGEYLFFLNPDTLVFKDTIDELVSFLFKNKNVGIIAPLLIDKNKIPFKLQGTTELTPLKGIICLSFIEKLFPNNPVSKNYWLKEWSHQTLREVGVCPGTALMVRRDLFRKIGGFDERFFLYFEEDDLAKRVRTQGYKIYITPKSKIFHEIGVSTKRFRNAKEVFSRSRFRYFKKHYGIFSALLVESFLSINKLFLFLFFILFLASLLVIMTYNK